VKMYHCGPTVYGDVHIGNHRSFMLADLLRRLFEWQGFTVTEVMNVTDIGHLSDDGDGGEDKMTKGLRREGLPITLAGMGQLAEKYTTRFLQDFDALNILRPHLVPRASQHIAEDIALISTLEKKGFTYTITDGVYFDTVKFPAYGALGNVSADDARESRIGDNSEKHSPRDFALWKFDATLGYESPWGKGFPGWHIECSAMSQKYLGDAFDIHTGGVDLAPVHHNNEIAQSVCATGAEFARFWLHNAFVNIASGKMARSEGTGISVTNLIEKGFSPLAYRYWLLGGHYRTPMTFGWESLQQADNALTNLRKLDFNTTTETMEPTHAAGKKYLAQLTEQLCDDVNTAEALATVWIAARDASLTPAEKRYIVQEADKVLGLNLISQLVQAPAVHIPQNVLDIVNKREEARKHKDWKESDTLRDTLKTFGYTITDTDSGPVVYKDMQ